MSPVDFSAHDLRNRLQLSLDCQFAEVRPAAETVRCFLRAQGCAAEDISACETALVEGCNNAIKYAGSSDEPVALEISCTAGQVEIIIHDHTAGFDWPQPARLPHPQAECGRGIYLVQALMDHSEYIKGEEENRLVMHKMRTGAAGQRSAPH